MSHNLTIVLTSSDLYSSIAESVGVTIDSSVGVFRVGKGLVCQLVPTLKPSKARDWLFEYRKRGYKGDHIGFLDLDYETIERFSQPGWRTILYNPAGEVIQANFPAQDADILDLGTLADADKLFAGKPTLQQCFGWWEGWLCAWRCCFEIGEKQSTRSWRIAAVCCMTSIKFRPWN